MVAIVTKRQVATVGTQRPLAPLSRAQSCAGRWARERRLSARSPIERRPSAPAGRGATAARGHSRPAVRGRNKAAVSCLCPAPSRHSTVTPSKALPFPQPALVNTVKAPGDRGRRRATSAGALYHSPVWRQPPPAREAAEATSCVCGGAIVAGRPAAAPERPPDRFE